MNKMTSALMAIFLAGGLAACDVDQTQEGEAPDVDVKGGQLPEYDVQGPDVDVKKEERQVTVPDVDVDVNKEKKTVTVPDVDVDAPPAD